MKTCPCCGNPLPDEAVFCPYCVKSINTRSCLKMPIRIPAKFLRTIVLALIAAAAAAGIFLYTRPKTYDGMGEVSYKDSDGNYQLLLSISNNRHLAMSEIHKNAGSEPSYRFPVQLYINHKDSGADASGIFKQKISHTSVEIEQPSDSPSPVQCSNPAPHEAFREAAQVSFIDFTRESRSPVQIIWTLHMKNEDIIRLRMDLSIFALPVYEYDSKDADLSDTAKLQAFLDRLSMEIDPRYEVNVSLPPVVYTEPLILWDRAFNLTGTEANGQRTTFSAGIQMRRQDDQSIRISYFTDIDFIGNGSGVGLSAADRVWAQNCRFLNWKTAILIFGNTWGNATDCSFENNKIGLYYNSTNAIPQDSRFLGNAFTRNETAVLLEHIPTDLQMNFGKCIFTDNGTDIDNRCDQPLNISEAIFQ